MKNIKVVIITGDHPRHTFFRLKFGLNKKIEVLSSYCESSLQNFVIQECDYNNIENIHFNERYNVELDFFEEVINNCEDLSHPKIIQLNEINNDNTIKEIKKLNPDYIITYGCSIIKPTLIELFPNRIINVHLGLSPYYFGSGTNFWPLVNNEPQLVGYTFMYIDEGIDTGEIIHQRRAKINTFDSIHQIGNRLIKDMSNDFVILIENFYKIEKKKAVTKYIGSTYKQKDVKEETIKTLYKNFKDGICLTYIKNKSNIDKDSPIIEQSFLKALY